MQHYYFTVGELWQSYSLSHLASEPYTTDTKLDKVLIALKSRVVGPGCMYKNDKTIQFIGETFKVSTTWRLPLCSQTANAQTWSCTLTQCSFAHLERRQ